MKGKLYGVGVGPGDPKLLTIKAVETIQAADCIAYPTSGVQADGSEATNLARNIIGAYIGEKPLLEYLMPMSKDREYVRRMHRECVEDLKAHLDLGKNIAFITLGDPSIYSTYMYIHHRITEMGYETALIPGIPSFCAAAASINDSLCEGSQPLIIIPASHETLDEALDCTGNKILMKPGKSLPHLREKLAAKDLLDRAKMVVKASMAEEKIYDRLGDIGEKSSYFSLIIVKEEKGKEYLS